MEWNLWIYCFHFCVSVCLCTLTQSRLCKIMTSSLHGMLRKIHFAWYNYYNGMPRIHPLLFDDHHPIYYYFWQIYALSECLLVYIIYLPSMLWHFWLDGSKGIWPVKTEWHGYLSAARCKWFAYGPADATVTSSSLASLNSRMVLPFWWWLTQVVLEQRLLNWM